MGVLMTLLRVTVSKLNRTIFYRRPVD